MSLKYSDIRDVEIGENESVSFQSLRNIYEKLTKNDCQMFGGGIRPKIWECKWYNDDSIPGYGIGDAVIVNSIDPDAFIEMYESQILDYIKFDSQTMKELERLQSGSYSSDRHNLYKKIAFGQNGRQPLYYIGSITLPIQIKVSTIDNNKTVPSDRNSQFWKDFIVRIDIQDVKDRIQKNLVDITSEIIETHEKDFHPDGEIESVRDEYAAQDLSNISKKQQFLGHQWYMDMQTGFDGVIQFQKKTDSRGNVKWFRVWNSGLVEHGGFLHLSQRMNEDSFTGSIYTVCLDWNYDTNNAPAYDYPQDGLRRTYDIVQNFEINGSRTSIQDVSVGKASRPVINLTPFTEGEVEPYSNFDESKYSYETIQVVRFDNNKFSVAIPDSGSITAFSYVVYGYSRESRGREDV